GSIAVGEIAATAARSLGVAPPAAPGELATATIAELADALERLAATAPEEEPAVPAGVSSWIRPFEHALVRRQAPSRAGTPTRWHVVGAAGDPLAAAAADAFAGGRGEEGVALVLPG